MTRHYFLGAAANYKKVFRHVFASGSHRDATKLEKYLGEKYDGEAILIKNGRSALALALKCYFNPGDKIIVNGFTCFAVVEAVKAAGCKPVYADIETKDLNFSVKTLEKCLGRGTAKGIIIQNTLGNPVNIKAISKFAKKNGLILIEDLAHAAGVKYTDGREAGTVGAATILSFGKEKSIDTISGGAVILRDFEAINGARFKIPRNARKTWVQELRPAKRARKSDSLRARYYPLFGKIYRGLSYVKLNGLFMRVLLKIHWVERSADNKLDLSRRPADFEAKLALKQLKDLNPEGEGAIREFYLLDNRDEILEKLSKVGYFFDGFWYEKPVAPERYYKQSGFKEKDCPTATLVARKIINFPTYYDEKKMAKARQILEEFGKHWEGEK